MKDCEYSNEKGQNPYYQFLRQPVPVMNDIQTQNYVNIFINVIIRKVWQICQSGSNFKGRVGQLIVGANFDIFFLENVVRNHGKRKMFNTEQYK